MSDSLPIPDATGHAELLRALWRTAQSLSAAEEELLADFDATCEEWRDTAE